MSRPFEIIYNQLISDEMMKNGTAYERLTAIVYKILDIENVVIHDMRLRGEGKIAAHQIDVTIEDSKRRKRVLVECKDYEKIVGIAVIRDFFGAVAQIKPDEAFVISKVGFTKGAVNFAKDEGIKLAILREFDEEKDWEGRFRSIELKMSMLFMDTPTITWKLLDQFELSKAKVNMLGKEDETYLISTVDTYFYDCEGNKTENFQEVFKPILNSFPRVPNEITKGEYVFSETKIINLFGDFYKVRGFEYQFCSYQVVSRETIDEGARVAVLLFQTLDGSIDQAVFDKDISKWTFNDNGEVIDKST